MKKAEPWDAIVVGSGATGGAAARQLTARGMRVLVLEAGRPVNDGAEYGSFLANGVRLLYRHFVSRRQHVQEAHPTYWSTNPDLFVDDVDNPYSTPANKPFRWIRGRQLGGRTLTWDAVVPRFSDFEFKAAELDGYGPTWPLTHAELAPYYSDLERLLGVHGSREGLPQLPDGEFLSGQRPMTPAERIFKSRVEREFGGRKVIISRGLRGGRNPAPGGRPSGISSQGTTLAAAAQTGRLTVRTDAVVSRILVEPNGAGACGVEIVDTTTLKTEALRAARVFLCASTIESVRILLNSHSPQHPDGIGGSSGVLGRYLMDHSAGNVYFSMPDVADDGSKHELLGSDSIMIPRFQNLGSQSEPYLRGFGIWGGIQRLPVPAFLHKTPGVAFGFLCARSETLPHADNRVEIDPDLRDAWGIPAARITLEWKEPDLKLAAAGRLATQQMVAAAGGKVADLTAIFHTPFVKSHIRSMQNEWRLSTPGMFVHEVGGARMGSDPGDSVVDPYCQVWDTKNVFVVDGACWPTSGWQNPTLTEMAIAARACDHAVTEAGARPDRSKRVPAALASLVGALLCVTAVAEEPWETTQTEPVVVKTRARAGTEVKEVWAEGTIAAAPVDIQSAVLNVSRFTKFMPYLTEARLVGGTDPDGAQYIYSKLELPILSARDFIHKTYVDRDATKDPQGVFQSHWFAVPDKLPNRHSVIRLQISDGSWLVTPNPDGTSHVVYHFAADIGGSVPTGPAQSANARAVGSTFKNVEREAQLRATERKASASRPGVASPAPAPAP